MNAPFKNPAQPYDTRPHAVIIGTGFGGLAAAIRLGARGFRVTMLEKLDAPGGRAYVYRQDGFTFDAGPTIITAPFLFEELWALCGRTLADDVELRSVTPFYRIIYADGATFDCSADPAAMRAEVERLSVADVAGYERFLASSKKAFEIGFLKMADVPYDRLMTMVRAIPDIIRLGGWQSVYGKVARYVKDERVRIALSFHPLFIGGNPFHATSIYTLISYLERHWGVHFAMGGTGSLVNGMTKLIESQGNTIRYNAEVRQILVEKGSATGVSLANGENLHADIVVSNADAAWTYGKMLPTARRARWSDGKLRRARYSMSLFVWYFGTKRQYDDVLHHTILLGPRYRELLEDIFQRKVLAKDFSLYLHRPTATDPSLAPPGHDAFYVLSPVPNLQSGMQWAEHSERYRKAIEEHLEATLLPGLSQAIVSSHVLDPQGFQDRMLAQHGAAFGLEPILTQSAWFRPHNRSEDVKNLYMVGAGTHPGAGVPGVLTSAKVLDQVVPDARSFARQHAGFHAPV